CSRRPSTPPATSSTAIRTPTWYGPRAPWSVASRSKPLRRRSSTGSAGIRRCPGRATSPGPSAPLASRSPRSPRSVTQAGPYASADRRATARGWGVRLRVGAPRASRACQAPGQMELETFTFDDDGAIPNSALPVLVYRGALRSDAGAAAHEDLFADNGWFGAWRDGIYPFHHFHSTSHEVLGIASGTANVVLGGPQGSRLAVIAGDVVVLPAGTGHCNAGSQPGLVVVGAYPNGMGWDLRRGDP